MDSLVSFAEAASTKLPESMRYSATAAEQSVFSELELNNMADQLEIDMAADSQYVHGEEYEDEETGNFW